MEIYLKINLMKAGFFLVVFFVCFGIGFGQFGPKQIISGATVDVLAIWDYTTVDLDNDGDLDVLATYANKIAWFENQGGLQFSHAITITTQDDFMRIAPADLDNDGDADVVYCSSNEDEIGWCENLGNGIFNPTAQILSITADGARSVAVADFNNDGNIDIAAASEYNDQIIWFQNLGAGMFSPPIVVSALADKAYSVCASDIDGDGYLDLLSASMNDNKIAWYKNNSGTGFAAQQIISTNAIGAKCARTADFDNDGDQDVVSASSVDNKIAWHENNGSGIFGGEQILTTSCFGASWIYTDDIDNDGYIEIFAAAQSGNNVIWFHNSGGLFGSPQTLTYLNEPTCVSSGDLDGDGDNEVLINSYMSRLSFLENLAPGIFSQENMLNLNFVSPKLLYPVDLDQDGDQDLLCASSHQVQISWLENNGDGFFEEQHFISASAQGACSVYAADIDGDLDLDVVSASEDDDKIAWYENIGNTVYGPQQVVSDTLEGAKTITCADLDQDGDQDIIAGSNFGAKVVWYENLGGSFSSEIVLASGVDGIHFVHCADLEGDGDQDVLFASWLDDKIAWFENMGAGLFGPEIIIDNTSGATWVGTADFNADGLLDVAGTSMWDESLLWFENLGAGLFGPPNILNDGLHNIKSASISDLDLDGDSDFAAAGSYTAEWIVWHENLDNGSFGNNINISNQIAYTICVQTADLDNDGDEEIIAIGDSYDDIVWFENYFFESRQIRGKLFLDHSGNGIQDTLDQGLIELQIESNFSQSFTYTYTNGKYIINLEDADSGMCLVYPDQNLNSYWSITTDSVIYHIPVYAGFQFADSVDFGIHPDTLIYEMTPELVGASAKCNHIVNYWAAFENTGTLETWNIIHVKLHDSLTFYNSNIPPDSINGQNIYWSSDTVNLFTDDVIRFQVNMPDYTMMGDTLLSTLTVIPIDTLGLYNNVKTDTLIQVLTCAYDPNDKTVEPTGIDSLGFISPDVASLDYTIRFQNTGNDTAQNVLIKDQLSEYLNWQSLDVLASSHEMTVNVLPAGEIEFVFDNIVLPDSNSSELESHGFVKFRVYFLTGLSIGTIIENYAKIYFDFNPPVITNTVLNTIYDCNILLNLALIPTSDCKSEVVSGNLYESNTNSNMFWYLDDTLMNDGPIFLWIADSIGTFNLDVQIQNSFCSADTSVQLTIFDQIPIQLLPNFEICLGDSTLLFGSYKSTPGTYYDTLQTINGCDSILSQQLDVLPLPSVNFNTLSQDTLCIYSGPITISGTPTGGNYSGNGVTSNQFNPSIAGQGTHYIYYNYTDVNGCSAIDSAKVFVDACLGIEPLTNYTISIYPNPFKDYTTIYFGQELKGNHSVVIYDLLGQVIYSVDNINGNQLEIQRNKLNSGVYIFSLFDATTGQEVYTTKLIVE